MCGIAGVAHADPRRAVDEPTLRRMARAIRHRGPDGYGMARTAGAGMTVTRLAIVDLPRGWQPFRTRTGGPVLAYNGEVYNHIELRATLAADGIGCDTNCDTEVIARLLERDGSAAADRFNGQFALAWWEPEPRRLTLIRDRFGVRPLHWALTDAGSLVFGSEIKAILASGLVGAAPDLAAIDEVFALWGAQSPATPFAGIRQLRPGHLLVWEDGRIVEERAWWRPRLGRSGSAASELEPLLRDSVELRLRADVPVGTYLSGGIDSSVISALARDASPHHLRSFSVAFADPRYDERAHQRRVADALGTLHHVVDVDAAQIAAAFPAVVWHAESPLVRTAPVPLALLARATREHGITVVATGEGADELYWCYDIFKEARARALLAHDPDSAAAAATLDALYPHLTAGAGRRGPAWRRFFAGAGAPDDPLFSHQTRLAAGSTARALYCDDARAALAGADPAARVAQRLPAGFGGWDLLERTAYLELTTLLEPYLLAAQGDRVAMAHGVETRYPFLDERVFEHAACAAAERKLDGMRDKAVLRDVAARVLPAAVAQRPKQPYRAPEVAPFFGAAEPDWVTEQLEPAALRAAGIFDPDRVAGLVRRCRAGRATGVREGMAVIGVLSTQLWHAGYCAAGPGAYPAEDAEPRVNLQAEPCPA
jgi:asparagine synthase (glutamine-hydrolysing)